MVRLTSVMVFACISGEAYKFPERIHSFRRAYRTAVGQSQSLPRHGICSEHQETLVLRFRQLPCPSGEHSRSFRVFPGMNARFRDEYIVSGVTGQPRVRGSPSLSLVIEPAL